MRSVPVLPYDILTQRNRLVGRISLGNPWEVFSQPGPEHSLCAHDDWPDFPERVVQIQGDGTNTVQLLIPKNDVETIVVL